MGFKRYADDEDDELEDESEDEDDEEEPEEENEAFVLANKLVQELGHRFGVCMVKEEEK